MKSQSSPQELFLQAIAGREDSKNAWEAVAELRRLGTKEVFELAVRYSDSKVAKHRSRALDVLGQLGGSSHPFRVRSVNIAVRRLAEDQDPRVVHAAAWALAHLKTPRAVEALLTVERHENPNVRRAVAYGLNFNLRTECIAALVCLTRDADRDVRDWALFGLSASGRKHARRVLNTPNVRAALRARLDDNHSDARDEALWSLAELHDKAALQALLQRCESKRYKFGDELAASDVLGIRSATREELVRGLQQLLAAKSAHPRA